MLYHQIVPALIREPLDARGHPCSIWVVGGAVRDHFLGFRSKDLDFAVDGDARKTARELANVLGAAYYDLDRERDVGRVLLPDPDGGNWTLDFTGLRGERIEDDLAGRDFTLNAIAVSATAQAELIDVTGGMQDLQQGLIRLCGPDSLLADPVRLLRLARFSAKLGFKIEPVSFQRAAEALPDLPSVSPERIRDEIFQILAPPNRTTGLRILEHLGALQIILPEIADLQGLEQSPPHAFDVWEHTLAVLSNLEDILKLMQAGDVNSVAGNLSLAEIALVLQPFRKSIQRRISLTLGGGRNIAQLLAFSVLYHDAGKLKTRGQDPDGGIQFLGHEAVSASLAGQRGWQLRLSNEEVKTITTVVKNHMRPGQLAKLDSLSRRAIIRFLRAAGQASVDILLLSIADFMGKQVPPADAEILSRRLQVCKRILEVQESWVGDLQASDPLIKGERLMAELGLPPGPVVGELLAYIREAQLVGDVQTPEEALRLARDAIDRG